MPDAYLGPTTLTAGPEPGAGHVFCLPTCTIRTGHNGLSDVGDQIDLSSMSQIRTLFLALAVVSLFSEHLLILTSGYFIVHELCDKSADGWMSVWTLLCPVNESTESACM